MEPRPTGTDSEDPGSLVGWGHSWLALRGSLIIGMVESTINPKLTYGCQPQHNKQSPEDYDNIPQWGSLGTWQKGHSEHHKHSGFVLVAFGATLKRI